MALKNVFAILICTMLLAWSGLAMGDEYRPDEFLGLDLSRAALSPKPLGPSAGFTPVPVEASADRGSESRQARVEPRAKPEIIIHRTRVAHRRAETRTKLAQRHGNPLDAQAFDTRIQVWPCRSGGICDWKRPAAGE